MVLMIVTEDLPDPENRVSLLDRVERDGLPGVKMRYALVRQHQGDDRLGI